MGELGDSDQGGSPASVRKLVARTNTAAWRLLLTKCRLLTENVCKLGPVCVVTRVRCVDDAETQGWHYLAPYDDDVAVRALLAAHASTRSSSATPHAATSAAAGAHSPKRTGSSC